MGDNGKITKIATKAVTQAVQEDDILRKHAKNLAMLSMVEAINVLRHGSPAAKAAMAGKFIPAIVRAIEADQQDDELVKMRNEYLAMAKEMGAPIFGEDDDD